MKSRDRILALLRFWFWSASWKHALFFAVYALMIAGQLANLYSLTGLGRAISIYFVIWWSPLLAYRKFSGVPPASGALIVGQPSAEFLFSRPIPRRQTQLFFCSLFLALVLGPVLAAMGVSTFDSDLCLEFRQGRGRATEAFDKLAEYRAQFPQSTIEPEHNADGEPPELVIPHGQYLAIGWMLEATALTALETLLNFGPLRGGRWPRKFGYGPLTLFLLLCSLLAQFRATDEIPVRIFFIFCHQWAWFALGTIVFAAFVLRTVGREASEIEA